MYTSGGFMLGFDRKKQNSVKQLSFNKKNKLKKKKNPPANAGDTGLIPGPGRFHMPWNN